MIFMQNRSSNLSSMSFSKALNNIPQTPSLARVFAELTLKLKNLYKKYYSKLPKAVAFRLSSA